MFTEKDIVRKLNTAAASLVEDVRKHGYKAIDFIDDSFGASDAMAEHLAELVEKCLKGEVDYRTAPVRQALIDELAADVHADLSEDLRFEVQALSHEINLEGEDDE